MRPLSMLPASGATVTVISSEEAVAVAVRPRTRAMAVICPRRSDASRRTVRLSLREYKKHSRAIVRWTHGSLSHRLYFGLFAEGCGACSRQM